MQQAFITIVVVLLAACDSKQENTFVDPNEIEYGTHIHEELPVVLLNKIRATTDLFDSIDGVSYEDAIDLYKRDPNPEASIEIWEEMARVYTNYCESRCVTKAEKSDVYKALLLRSMFSASEAIEQLELQALSVADAQKVMEEYSIPPTPIEVYKQ